MVVDGAFRHSEPVGDPAAGQPVGGRLPLPATHTNERRAQLKPGLDLLVTATVDAARLAAAGPPVERYEIALAGRPGGTPASRRLHVGDRAQDAAGVAVREDR